jgi:hypothetical protein
MRFRTILSLATLFLTCFTLAVWSQPLPAQPLGHSPGTAVENQSVSGRISSIGDASFAVEVAKGNQSKQTLQFLVDDSTKMEGKLVVGAKAVVEYRSNGGTNLAVRVVVTPASGAHSN